MNVTILIRFYHLGLLFLKPSDNSKISFSKILHLIQGAQLLEA